jgi:hypothetical protein
VTDRRSEAAKKASGKVFSSRAAAGKTTKNEESLAFSPNLFRPGTPVAFKWATRGSDCHRRSVPVQAPADIGRGGFPTSFFA